MTKKTRMFTGLVAAAMVLVLLFSALYIAVEADHSCTGEDCAVNNNAPALLCIYNGTLSRGDFV